MRYRLAAAWAVAGSAVAALALSAPSVAHHSFSSEFDATRPVAVEGNITKVRIVNPHGWLFLDVKNPDGSKTNWGFEFGSPAALKARALNREELKVGSKIKISGYRARNTGPYGYAQTAELSDGRTFKVGGAPDAPVARAAR